MRGGGGVRVFLMENATNGFNLEKIAPLRQAKCNSEEIVKKITFIK